MLQAMHVHTGCMLLICLLIVPTNQQAHKIFSTDTHQQRMHKSVPYFKASIPMRIYECLREFSILRCAKLYMLQKMEQRKQFPNTGNLKKDFMEQFFGDEVEMGSLTNAKYRLMSDLEFNQRLVHNFQRFFKNRNIKMHFLPGMLLKIVPSKENKLKFMLMQKTKSHNDRSYYRESNAKTLNMNTDLSDESASKLDSDSKQQSDISGIGTGGSKASGSGSKIGKSRHKNKKSSHKMTMIQVAVPILIMPAILLASILPFILPALKLATMMSLLMNNGAFWAALIYAARTHVNSQDEQHINYGYGGNHH